MTLKKKSARKSAPKKIAKLRSPHVFKLTPELMQFIESYANSIDNGTAAVFAGAGLSIPAGLKDWKTLLSELARDVGLDVDEEHDLIAVAQYHLNKHGTRHGINERLVNEFSERSKETENHQILSSLPIETYWTTNYDHLIEDSLKRCGKTPDVKITQDQLATVLYTRDAVVYKMHGDVSHASDTVVTKDDYHDYNHDRELFTTSLKGDLLGKSFVFLGFSFNDPNIDFIFNRMRFLIKDKAREHFCLMRSVRATDFINEQSKIHNAKFKYAANKQRLQIDDLKRYGVRVVLFEEFSDLTEILKRVSARVLRNRVFIGGSAHEYGSFGPEHSAEFIHKLTVRLLESGFKIVTGFGLGVGDAVINGALSFAASKNSHRIDRFITMRPFPQVATGGIDLKMRWRTYRQMVLSEAGLAVFLFGNKLDRRTNSVVAANGLIEEFEICLSQGTPVIPVGATGFVAQELAQSLIGKKDVPWLGTKICTQIKSLSKPVTNLDKLIEPIIKLVKQLKLSFDNDQEF